MCSRCRSDPWACCVSASMSQRSADRRGCQLIRPEGGFVLGKNIVVCLDGTGNQLKAKGNTNVVRLYEMLDLSDPSKQIAYYDPGVGTFSAQGAWTPVGRSVSKLVGLA